jgi:hypothetical protein
LDIFKVTRSDYEDSDYFEDSDNEMLFDMENMLKQSKKFNSKSTSFELLSMEFTTNAGSNPKIDSPSRRDRNRGRTNNSFQDMGTKFKEDGDSQNKGKSRKTSFQSQQVKKVVADGTTDSSKNDLSSVRGESNIEDLKKMDQFGSINVEMNVGESMKGVGSPKNDALL